MFCIFSYHSFWMAYWELAKQPDRKTKTAMRGRWATKAQTELPRNYLTATPFVVSRALYGRKHLFEGPYIALCSPSKGPIQVYSCSRLSHLQQWPLEPTAAATQLLFAGSAQRRRNTRIVAIVNYYYSLALRRRVGGHNLLQLLKKWYKKLWFLINNNKKMPQDYLWLAQATWTRDNQNRIQEGRSNLCRHTIPYNSFSRGNFHTNRTFFEARSIVLKKCFPSW